MDRGACWCVKKARCCGSRFTDRVSDLRPSELHKLHRFNATRGQQSAPTCIHQGLSQNSDGSAVKSAPAPGVGPDLLWFDLPSGALLLRARIFAAARVHGLSIHPDDESAAAATSDAPAPLPADGSPKAALLVAHGGRDVAVLRLTTTVVCGGSASGPPPCATAQWRPPAFRHWVLCARLLSGDGSAAAAGRPAALVGALGSRRFGLCSARAKSLRTRRSPVWATVASLILSDRLRRHPAPSLQSASPTTAWSFGTAQPRLLHPSAAAAPLSGACYTRWLCMDTTLETSGTCPAALRHAAGRARPALFHFQKLHR